MDTGQGFVLRLFTPMFDQLLPLLSAKSFFMRLLSSIEVTQADLSKNILLSFHAQYSFLGDNAADSA
ncbi:hypothetical protein [Rosenbergiella australiborealis]|uniref:hypothetical protein n=1 Tax=Rosenbergiella australiborealis TaxID=1544696 RepID=UPI001F4D8C00|nr:hypothetical protein [Rosenbergiella australiborealis]